MHESYNINTENAQYSRSNFVCASTVCCCSEVVRVRVRIVSRRCSKCHRARWFSLGPCAHVCLKLSLSRTRARGRLYVSAYHIRNLQSLEILLVAPWKMYDALLLKASKRKFQCLDISSSCPPPPAVLFHRFGPTDPTPSSLFIPEHRDILKPPAASPEGGYKCK